MTFSEFITLHPQFAQASQEMVEQALIDAADQVSETVFGDSYSLALRMKACHILTLEMFGQQASLTGGETTVYEKKFQALKAIKVVGAIYT